MANGPKIWDPLLTTCAAVYGSAVIAGGAVRDWSINKNLNPRDIDIFVPVEDELDLEMGIRKLSDVWRYVTLIEPQNLGSYSADELAASNVVGVLEARFGDLSTKVNVIGKAFDVYDTQRLFADFDHSLCQFAYNGESITISDDATNTLDTGAITVYTPVRKTQVRLDSLLSRKKAYERFTYDASVFPVEETKNTFKYYLKNEFERILAVPPNQFDIHMNEWRLPNIQVR